MQYRRIRSPERSGLLPTVLLGLGLGLAAGLVLGELLGGQDRKRLARTLTPWRNRPPKAPDPADQTGRLEAALRNALGSDAEGLELVRVGRRAIELHGWVDSRAARARAVRAARAAIGADLDLVDSLLVWGEDDLPTTETPIPEELESA